MVACYSLQCKFTCTLASGVLLMQESSVNIIARFLHVGKTFQEFSRIYMYRNTVPPWLTNHHAHGCEKQDKWTVGEKRSTCKQE